MITLVQTKGCNELDPVYRGLVQSLLTVGKKVDTGHWQAVSNVAQTRTIELQQVAFEMAIPPTRGSLASFVKPNLPWAEAHFQERVAGRPTNPGDQYMNWPWYKPDWEAQEKEQGKFSHTYQERFWPRFAGKEYEGFEANEDGGPWNGRTGVRFRYGDLSDVLELLRSEPHTRQAYLPIWFPEDTGAHHNERVPCTLGYHLMLRQDRLHCFYAIRSCDVVRYFKDDVYMAGRLVQWVLNQLNDNRNLWRYVVPGELSMFIHSLHCFEDEVPALEKKYDVVATTR